jgi:hypothetical protein
MLMMYSTTSVNSYDPLLFLLHYSKMSRMNGEKSILKYLAI